MTGLQANDIKVADSQTSRQAGRKVRSQGVGQQPDARQLCMQADTNKHQASESSKEASPRPTLKVG